MPGVHLPELSVEDNAEGWGPLSEPPQFKDVPFMPYSKGDRLGRIADFGQMASQRQYQGGWRWRGACGAVQQAVPALPCRFRGRLACCWDCAGALLPRPEAYAAAAALQAATATSRAGRRYSTLRRRRRCAGGGQRAAGAAHTLARATCAAPCMRTGGHSRAAPPTHLRDATFTTPRCRRCHRRF